VRAWADRWLYFHAADKDLAPLRARVEEVEQALGLPGNRSFYLSLPPAAFPKTVDQLGGCGLTAGPGWKRLVVEKPFGRDLASARELNAIVHRHFDESQVYRIDHYLGKETVQNLLVFRFANAMFESVWDRDHVESVMITVAEELGVEERAGYYETAGALRDMVQSHLTQLMTLVAMEVPRRWTPTASAPRSSRCCARCGPLAPTDAVLGQYEPGELPAPTAACATRAATARSRAWRPTRAPRRSSPSRCTSRTGAGRGCRSSCARGSACRGA
jgi:glucose-6-phosphate 1-dehydrogenase